MAKRIVFTQGGKGGVGKTTAALSLYDYYQTKEAAVTLADFDGENRAKSGLNFWHKTAEKVDIHTRSGLDKLIDLTLGSARRHHSRRHGSRQRSCHLSVVRRHLSGAGSRGS